MNNVNNKFCLKVSTLVIILFLLNFPVFLLNSNIPNESENGIIVSSKIKNSGSGNLVKLMMTNYESQGFTADQQFIESREYLRTPDPLERLEEGEEYTKIDIDLTVQTEFNFNFLLTDRDDNPISNSIVWMHIGFMPKSEDKFIDENYNQLYEALGTGPYGYQGPGTGTDRMFGRPLIYSADQGQFGPYFWKYNLTDVNGIASFKIKFNHNYLMDFSDIFGTGHGVLSIEDSPLYMRIICSNFSWNDFTISNPDQYICSSNENVFDGSDIIEDYDFTALENQDPTYIEGLIQLHKGKTKIILKERLNIDLPETEADCEDIEIDIDVVRDDMASFSILDSKYYDGYTYHVFCDIYNPSGVYVDSFHQSIARLPEGGGRVWIDDYTLKYLYEELGPGVSILKMLIGESDNYLASPILNIPFEINPPNNSTFDRTRSYKLNLINPFISAWGSCYEDDKKLPFESNFPYLIGKFWFNPDFLGTGTNKERSFQDYLKVYLICTIHNDDGTVNEFPLKECLMLRPGNYDGIINFVAGFGPEDAFLMDKNCSIKLIFNADYNKVQISEQERELILYILDLKIVNNPSSLEENIIWSLYDDQFTSSNINIEIETNTISSSTGTLIIGSEDNNFGIETIFTYDNTETTYSLRDEDEILLLPSLISIDPIAVIGNNGIVDEYKFVKDIDWIQHPNPNSLRDYSTIIFIGDTPESNTDFKVLYRLNFNYINKYYGNVSFNGPSSNNIFYSWIDFSIPPKFMNSSQNKLSPMYVRYTETFSAGSQNYQLSYGLDDINSWDDNFIIYNENELNSFTKSVSSEGFPILTFSTAQTTDFNVIYGIKSQYDIGYGFQKNNKWYSDSIRTIFNNQSNIHSIINSSLNQINTSIIKYPSLYIGLDNSDSQTTLELTNIPIYYDPALNFSFRLDPIIIDQIKQFGPFNTLKISFDISSINFVFDISDSLEVDLNYDGFKNNLESDGSYIINHNINLFSAFQSIDSDYFYINITFSQLGLNPNNIPYIILETFEYEHNSLFLKMNDYKPQDRYGHLDVKAVVYTSHYIQLFSNPFRDISAYTLYDAYMNSPFNLSNNSKITISLEGIPNATLISLLVLSEYDYRINNLGNNTIITINDTNCNMLINLALFLNLYNIENQIIQNGFINVYNGTDTSESHRIDRKHFYFLVYEQTQPLTPFLNDIMGSFSNNWGISFREGYRNLYGNNILWPTDCMLTLEEIYSEISNQRSVLDEYIEPSDLVAPIISIQKPMNNEKFEEDAPEFQISVIHNNLEKLWYIINDLPYITPCDTYGQINQTIWDSLKQGNQTIRFYSEDKLGIITFYERVVYKIVTSEDLSPENGDSNDSEDSKNVNENNFIIIAVTSTIAVVGISTGVFILYKKLIKRKLI